MVGVHVGLKPMLIKEYSDDFELIVVEMNVAGKEVRIISGYGPQETWKENERMPLFLALEVHHHPDGCQQQALARDSAAGPPWPEYQWTYSIWNNREAWALRSKWIKG